MLSNPCERMNREKVALHLVPTGFGMLLLSAYLFLSLTLLALALVQAGRVDDAGASITDCDGTVYGRLRPIAILSAACTIGSVANALYVSYVGAVIDHTPHRRRFGAAMAATLVLINAVQAFVFKEK